MARHVDFLNTAGSAEEQLRIITPPRPLADFGAVLSRWCPIRNMVSGQAFHPKSEEGVIPPVQAQLSVSPAP
jgi:hypothetical protein